MTLCVNGEPIPDEAIEFEFRRLVKFYSQHMPAEQVERQEDALRQKARDQAIGAKLLMKEASDLDLQVPTADIDKKLAELMQQTGGQAKFEALLKKQGIPLETIRTSLERGRKVELLIDKITAGVPDPSEDEMKAHYKEHAAEYTKNEMAQVQHILVKPESDGDEDRATARSRLAEIRERIVEEGAAFEDEAAAHSECPSGQRSGGNLGWLTRGTMVPVIDEAVFALKDGEITAVIESELGLHIMRRNATEKGGVAAYAEVAESIRDFLRHARRGEVIAVYVEDLKKKAVIEES